MLQKRIICRYLSNICITGIIITYSTTYLSVLTPTHLPHTGVQTVTVSPEVQEMCAQVGKILAKYRSGPLPKMFKVIPKMRSWEELVYLTGEWCFWSREF